MGTRNRLNGSDINTNRLPLFNLSEFPSLSTSILTIRNIDDNNISQSSSMPSVQPNVGIAQQSSEVGEFIMSAKDFPALPSTYNRDGASQGRNIWGDDKEENYWRSVSDKDSGSDSEAEHVLEQELDNMKNFLNNMITDDSDKMNTCKSGISFINDKAENIPGSMLNDQFGIAGLLRYINMADNDSDLVSLSLGEDIATLGLNLDSPGNLYSTFGGPWAKEPCQTDDVEFQMPPEYAFDPFMRNTLVPGKLDKYREELFLAAREL